jgi:hypothetical protein
MSTVIKPNLNKVAQTTDATDAADIDLQDDSDEVEEKVDLFQLIHDDNALVADLFFQFTQAEDDDDKQEIFDAINDGLHIHSQIVEEFLFPAVIDSAKKEDREEAEKLVAVAEAGNYVAALLLDELEDMELDDEFFEAKMTILCENVRQQVKREEKEMFEKLRIAKVDADELGESAMQLLNDLESGIGQDPEPQPKSKAKKPAKTSKAKAPAKKSAKPGVKKSAPKTKSKAKPAKKSAPKAKTQSARNPAKNTAGKATKKKSR